MTMDGKQPGVPDDLNGLANELSDLTRGLGGSPRRKVRTIFQALALGLRTSSDPRAQGIATLLSLIAFLFLGGNGKKKPRKRIGEP